MPQFSDYKCSKCGFLIEFAKERMVDSFPSSIKCTQENCDGEAVRIYSSPFTEIAEGRCGNAKNGYATGITYHPSTAVGKSYKGTKI